MKYLLLLAVIAVALMLWRSGRRAQAPGQAQRKAPPAGAQDMVKCARCPVHLPRGEALAGRDGLLYCSTEHRRLSEG